MTAYERLVASDIRKSPDKQLIEQIRQRYPTEKEIDRILTKKMTLRSGSGFISIPVGDLAAGVQKLIEHNVGYPVKLANTKWLPGGASKLQMMFDLHWHGPGKTGGDIIVTPLVLRMEPPASVTESSRRREFQVFQAVSSIVPVPTTYWMDPEGDFLPHPAIVYGFARGVAKPSKDANKVSGLGQNYGPELRKKLAPQFVGLLAKIHNIDVSTLNGLEDFEFPVAGSNAAVIKQVNYCRRLWEEDRIEEEPMLEIAYQWLIKNAPPIDHVSLVHGDYRSGNFLFDEASGEITAWLDWEGAVLGDRHRDLTYATLYTFQHLDEDGKTPLASGMMSEEEMFKAYERASGLSVDPARIVYYGVFNRYLATVLSLGASARAAYGGKTHQDVLLNYVAGIGYPILADLREYFEKVVV
jgi:aminoglycoside phosphotransferase (APT) family kinase protein